MFLTDADRRHCLSLLGNSAVRYGWEVLSYCLMDTHWHLLVRTPEPTFVHRNAPVEQLLLPRLQPPARPQRSLDPPPIHVGRGRRRSPPVRADPLPAAEPCARWPDPPPGGLDLVELPRGAGRRPRTDLAARPLVGRAARLRRAPAPLRRREHGGAGRPVDARLRSHAYSSSTGGMNGSSAPGLGVRSISSPSPTATASPYTDAATPAGSSSSGSSVAVMDTLRYRLRPVDAGISLPMITFSLSPFSESDLPSRAASVSTFVVSWNEAADRKLSVASEAFVMPRMIGVHSSPSFFAFFSFATSVSSFGLSTSSPGSIESLSPAESSRTFFSIWRTISSMCLSWISTPWLL